MEPARLGLKDLDLTEAVSNPDNVFLANEFGGFLFVKDDYTYEVHTNFLPAGRGKAALAAAKEAARYMFQETDCLAIRTYVPVGNVAADALTRRMGFTQWGTAEVCGHEAKLYMLTIKEWVRCLSRQS